MENTKEWKTKFFSQYWGQKVVFTKNGKKYGNVNGYLLDTDYILTITLLQLKPLQSISDEDAIEVANIISRTVTEFDTGNPVKYIKEQILEDPIVLAYATSETVDYLRLNGYALRWNGVSTEQQIEWGWIKIKTD